MTTTPSRPTRRTSDSGDSSAYTVKELVLRLDAKVDTYIISHGNQHANEQQQVMSGSADPNSTAAGRALVAGQADLASDISLLRDTVVSHERSIQRLIGAMALIVFLGGGAFIVAALSTAGRLLGVPIP